MMANLSQQKRQRMMEFLSKLKEEHKDDDSVLIALGQMKMQNRHMCMCAGESKLQMQQNFGLQQMELNLIIIKVRFRRMI